MKDELKPEEIKPKYKADFLWPHCKAGNLEALLYDFANCGTEEYRKEIYIAIKKLIASPQQTVPMDELLNKVNGIVFDECIDKAYCGVPEAICDKIKILCQSEAVQTESVNQRLVEALELAIDMIVKATERNPLTPVGEEELFRIKSALESSKTVESKARRNKLREALKALLVAVCFKTPVVNFGTEEEPNPCWEARVPVQFVDDAHKALEGKE